LGNIYDETKEKIPKVILAHNSGTKAKNALNHTSAIKIRSKYLYKSQFMTTNQKSQLTGTSQSAKRSVFHNSREYKL
jgi:hypothetical protein